jgi:hypothetical protein
MGRIVSNFFMSLDGVVETPDQWHMPYFNEEMGAAIGKGMETMELVEHEVFSTGVLNLTYVPAA